MLCRAIRLSDAMKNISSNVWKYAVPANGGQNAEVVWQISFSERRIQLVVESTGPTLPCDFKFFEDESRGHARARASIKDFGGTYNVVPIATGGVRVEIEMIYRR